MTRTTRAIVDLDALEHNYLQAKALAKTKKIMAVVKADAYGHGVAAVATRLAPLCDSFAVATVEEGVALRQVVGHGQPIVVLSSFQYEDEVALLQSHDLSPVLHDHQQLHVLSVARHHSQTGTRPTLNVWVKINTGMNRAGFNEDEFDGVLSALDQQGNVHVQGVMSHLACADDADNVFSAEQIKVFKRTLKGFNGTRSLANSAGVVAWPDSHQDIVRPGIMLYGVSPVINSTASELMLRPVMRFESSLIAIRQVKAGDYIGYGQTYESAQPDRIGLVGCGYGDGYPRLVSDGTLVQVGSQLAPKVGRVSMDSFAVSLATIPHARVGDTVVLWGGRVCVEDVAHSAGTIAYETLCQLPARVPRIYHSNRVMDLVAD